MAKDLVPSILYLTVINTLQEVSELTVGCRVFMCGKFCLRHVIYNLFLTINTFPYQKRLLAVKFFTKIFHCKMGPT